MNIVTVPNPILRKECADVDLASEPGLAKTVKEMAKLMYEFNGCGIAAPQVGILKKIVVVDVDYDETKRKEPIFLINPRVVSTDGEMVTDIEGCLSVPGIQVEVARCEDAVVEALDLDGNEVRIEADGFFARCLQHEIDHLHGITMLEHLPVVQRLEKIEEYKRACASGAKPGEVD